MELQDSLTSVLGKFIELIRKALVYKCYTQWIPEFCMCLSKTSISKVYTLLYNQVAFIADNGNAEDISLFQQSISHCTLLHSE